MFGDRLKELRKKNNIKQEDLAEKIKVTQNTVSNWECNTAKPDVDTIILLSKIFNVSTDYLLGLEDAEIKKIERINQLLRETNIIDTYDNLDEEELKVAIEQVKKYKAVLFNKIMNVPSKYFNPNKDTK